ncbi:CD2-associated protein [Arapaima gigas]
MVDVVVEYDYEAMHEDELTLRPGDVIRDVRKIEEEGWMEGTLNGRRGLFPDNFVKEIKKDVVDAQKEEAVVKRDRSSGNVASLVQRMSTYGIPAGGFQPHSLPTSFPKKTKKRRCRALFEYTPQNQDELELKVGDIIEITEEVEEGWWSGILHGKHGLFPSNFVKEFEVPDDEDNNDATDETDNAAKDGSTAGPITPTSPGTGNGVVAQPKKVRGIGFGDIFKEGSVKLKARLSSSEPEEKKTDKPLPSLPSAAKPTLLNMTDSVKADGENRTKVKEYCKVIFPFDATNDDELRLKEGDTIHILSKVVTHLFSYSTGDKPVFDHRPSVKPAAPLVPPKKPLVPPGKGPSPPLKPASVPPKRPEKPQAAFLGTRSNGEILAPRPKSDFEPLLPSKPKTLSGDWGEKAEETDLMSFDDFLSTSEKLSHPTASRPKMPGRRLPGQFVGGLSPSREANVEKAVKVEDEDHLKPKLPPSSTSSFPAPKSSLNSSAVPEPVSDSKSEPKSEPRPESKPEPKLELKFKGSVEDRQSEMEDLRAQMKELLLTVELLKTQQTREIADLRSDLDEEKAKRKALQMEIDKLKKTIHAT